jgi:general secretion pathway protein A
MYQDYWQLEMMPFDNAPDHRFFFESKGHQEAITRISFGIQTRKAIVLLTGDYGIGKTVVCETVINQLSPTQYKVAFITNPRMDAIDLTREITYQLGEDISSRSSYDVLHALNNLLERHASTGKHCAVIVDEAQVVLDSMILEDLRLLLNKQMNGRFLMTLVLVGQTELGDRLRALPQMVQRIGLKFHIPHLQPDEVPAYIKHRWTKAGGKQEVFTPEAISEIARISKGNPRDINALCDLTLLIGALTKKDKIGIAEVQEAARERA